MFNVCNKSKEQSKPDPRRGSTKWLCGTLFRLRFLKISQAENYDYPYNYFIKIIVIMKRT